MRSTINEEGKTRVRARYVVSAPVTGQLRRIELKAGAPVEANRTTLAVLDPLTPALLDARSRSLAQARRSTAAANLEKAQAAQRFSQGELQRFARLFKEGAVSIQEREAAEWRAAAAAQEFSAAESALRLAEAELAEFSGQAVEPSSERRPPTEVRSPVDGRVLRVLEESARAVLAGTPLLELGDPADIEVVIEVLSRDGAELAPGTPILLEQWGGLKPLEARVRLVEPSAFTKVSALGVEEQRVRVIADLVSPPAERPGLGDQFRVEARIVVWETKEALKVPTGAVFRHRDQWAVYVVKGGRARLTPVSVGRSSGTETQVLDGLAVGEALVLYPGDRVRDGVRVRQIEI
jgi:HlyD family secretion protein